jgi:hypothetical protein
MTKLIVGIILIGIIVYIANRIVKQRMKKDE